MFKFLRRSQGPELSVTICQALVDDRLSAEIDPRSLGVVHRRGSYSGRQVNYFRVFDPAVAVTRGIVPRRFEDLDIHPELIMGTGHVEHGGAVVLSPLATARQRPTSARVLADRQSHGDDERVVFPDGATS